MAETVFILAKVSAAHLESILSSLEMMESVKHLHAVTGAYDLLICMEGDDLAGLLSSALKEVVTLEGITSTETLVSIDLK